MPAIWINLAFIVPLRHSYSTRNPLYIKDFGSSSVFLFFYHNKIAAAGGALPKKTLSQRVMGIEPTQPAWEAGVLPLNYTRISAYLKSIYTNSKSLSRGNIYIAASDQRQARLCVEWTWSGSGVVYGWISTGSSLADILQVELFFHQLIQYLPRLIPVGITDSGIIFVQSFRFCPTSQFTEGLGSNAILCQITCPTLSQTMDT